MAQPSPGTEHLDDCISLRKNTARQKIQNGLFVCYLPSSRVKLVKFLLERVSMTSAAVVGLWATKIRDAFQVESRSKLYSHPADFNFKHTDTQLHKHRGAQTHTRNALNQIKETSALLLPERCHSNDGVPEGGWDAGEFTGA